VRWRVGQHVADRPCGQDVLGQEPDGRARRDQVAVVLLGVARDQDDPCPEVLLAVQPSGHLESALPAEVDVEQHHVGPELVCPAQRLLAGRGHAHDRDPLPLQQPAGRSGEHRVVVDDQALNHESILTVAPLHPHSS
jgi:hypothetical protein